MVALRTLDDELVLREVATSVSLTEDYIPVLVSGVVQRMTPTLLVGLIDTTLIEDSITNGVVDKAPSQNAVFNALALKVNKAGDIITGNLEINKSGVTLAAGLSGTLLHLANIDGTSSRLMLDTVAQNTNFTGRRANGTSNAKTALVLNDTFLTLGGLGYGTTGYANAARATISFVATENWTDTAQGTRISFGTSPNGGAVSTSRWGIENDGSFVYNGGTLTGASTINAVDYFDNGVNITTIYARVASANVFTASQQVRGDGVIDFTVSRYQNIAGGPRIDQEKARGSFAAPLIVATGDTILTNRARAYDGSTFVTVGQIAITCIEATPSSTALQSRFVVTLAPAGSVAGTTTQLQLDTTGGLQLFNSGVPSIDVNRFFCLRQYTVATLPTAGTAGRLAAVTDANAPSFGATVVGGGAVKIPVYDNGTNWIVV